MKLLKKSSILLALCLACVLVLAACGQKKDNFSRGTISGNKYSNSFMGIQFEAPSDWTFATDAELAQDNGLSEDEFVDNFNTLVKNQQLYDMYAQRSDGTNISIIVQNAKGVSKSSLKKEIENAAPSVEEALSQQGATDISWKMSDVSIPLKDYAVLDVSSKLSGIAIYQKQVYALVDDYAYINTLTCVGEDESDEIYGYFKKLN